VDGWRVEPPCGSGDDGAVRTLCSPFSFLLVLLLLGLSTACGEPPEQPPGQDPAPDAGTGDPVPPLPPDGGQPDGGHEEETEQPGDGGLPAQCEGECRQTTLSAEVGARQGNFERVQFGFTSPQRSGRDRWELHVEAHSGGSAECPIESSPLPDRTLVLGRIPLPQSQEPLTMEDGLSGSLLDFSGALGEELLRRATALELRPTAFEACLDCPDRDPGERAERFFSFELRATFDDGTVEGTGFATHCASMDEL
jgi:hypothetical protein